MRLTTWLGLGLCVSSACACAQPTHTKPLSLRDCINLALARNLDIRIQRLSVNLSDDALTSAYGAYSPNFSFGATHNFASEEGDFDPRKFNPYFPSDITTQNVGPELSGKVPFGLSYDLNGFVRENKAATDFAADPQDAAFFPNGIRRTNDFNAAAALTLRQHLLRDFWIDSDREVLLARRKELKMSQQALRFQIMKTLLAVELSYEDLVDAREEIRVQEDALALRRQFVAETQRRVQVGQSPQLDLAQAQTQLQNTLTALAAARETFAAAQNALIGLLTDRFRDWADTQVMPTDALFALPPNANREQSFADAVRNRPDLIEARLAVEKAGTMARFRLNQLFPSLDLVGGYGVLGSAPDSGGSLDDAFSFGHQEYSYGVVVSFPLDNATDRGNYRASKTSKDLAELQLQKAEQEVLLQVADFVDRVDVRYSQVASTRQARVYAEQALSAETEKWTNGYTTSFDVLQYQQILTEARTAEIRSTVDYNKLLAQLAFAEGALLEKDDLSLEVK